MSHFTIIEKLQTVLFPPFCVSYIMSLPIDSCTKLGMIQEAVIEAVIKSMRPLGRGW